MASYDEGRKWHNIAYVVAVVVTLAAISGCTAYGDDAPIDAYGLSIMSSRSDMVTGGDALVAVALPAPVDVNDVSLRLGDQLVASELLSAGEGVWLGIVSGLPEGAVNLALVRSDGTRAVAIELVNHESQGPVFSGPHQQPFVCQTDQFDLVSGETLGAPQDETCAIERRVDYAYRSVDGGDLQPLDEAASRPADLATTTTLDGAEVPYIVRIETGTINRAIYQIAVLHDPSAATPDPWTRSAGWNGRLIYTFGGGCVNGWYRQGATTGGVTDDTMLSQGYAVASSSLNVYGNNCNDVLAAETMMMVKERFIEAYGPPRYTIGWGCSGGAYQNHQIADNYPGLLDGIIPGCSFSDVAFGTIPMITDARLLDRYFKGGESVPFTKDEQRAVAGFLTLATMPNVSRNAGRIHVTEFCPDVLPEAERYHPVDNPDGARCDVYDHYINVYGRDPDTGFAQRPLDNVGVQYGLDALNAGAISPAQFLDLNARIGGYDGDGNPQPERTTADVDAIRRAYATGRLTNGGGGLAAVPIIDYRAYVDDREDGDVHVRYHSFSMRERLRAANGTTDNHIMLVEDDRHGLYSGQSPVLRQALRQMDQWLENLENDPSDDAPIERIRRAKPADLVDACWSRDDTPSRIAETQVRGQGRCEELYPSAPSPREVAGAPLAGTIVKCQLTPVDPTAYAVGFSPQEADRLREIFSDGVCDWSKPSVGHAPLEGTWLSFGTT